MRLGAAPLTDEDCLCLVYPRSRLRRGVVWLGLLHARGLESDRRDADLMLELVDLRSIGAYANVRRLQAWAGQDGFVFRSWMGWYSWAGRPARDDSGYGITYFA